MRKSKFKQVKHNFQKKQYELKKHKAQDEFHHQLLSGKTRNKHRLIMHTIPNKYISNDNIINKYRLHSIALLLKDKPEKRASRLSLAGYEGKVIEVLGILSDIKRDSKSTRLLLENPTMMKNGTGFSYIDQHIWLFLDKLIGRGPDIIGNQELSIGDYIYITALVKTYRGKSNNINHFTYRWGIDKFILQEAGQPTKHPTHHKLTAFVNQYNRKGDWVVKFHKLPYVKDEQLPHYDKPNTYTYDYKPSIYPSYQKRMNIK